MTTAEEDIRTLRSGSIKRSAMQLKPRPYLAFRDRKVLDGNDCSVFAYDRMRGGLAARMTVWFVTTNCGPCIARDMAAPPANRFPSVKINDL